VNTRTMTMARVSRLSLVLAAAAALALSMSYLVRPALATQPDPLHKVTICHRTNAETNPYVRITVDEASVDGDNGNDHGKGDHLFEHTGPVWYSGAKADGVTWGDIIPPFYSDGSTLTGYPSLNWDTDGQAIFDNGCNGAEEQSVAGSESEAESVAESESEPESVAESESQPESVGESESQPESVGESESASGEQSEKAGEGTPAASISDGALSLNGSSPLPAIAFSLILLASLGALAYANVKSVRNIS
jgi:hypothetical protein